MWPHLHLSIWEKFLKLNFLFFSITGLFCFALVCFLLAHSLISSSLGHYTQLLLPASNAALKGGAEILIRAELCGSRGWDGPAPGEPTLPGPGPSPRSQHGPCLGTQSKSAGAKGMHSLQGCCAAVTAEGGGCTAKARAASTSRCRCICLVRLALVARWGQRRCRVTRTATLQCRPPALWAEDRELAYFCFSFTKNN